MTTLTYGPLNKNIFTHQLELIAKTILYTPNNVVFYPDNHMLHAKIGNINLNVSEILNKANFSHIMLNEADSKQHIESQIPTFSPISRVEKMTVENYTGLGYGRINNFLRNYNKNVEKIYFSDPVNSFSDHIRSQLLSSVLLSSALNKIIPSSEVIPTYRGEHTKGAELLEIRIKKIQTDEIDKFDAFLSTSTDKNVAEIFGTYDYNWRNGDTKSAIIIFADDYGKNIQSLSVFPDEKEFLIIPGQKFLYTECNVTATKITYHAKAVAPLIEAEEFYTPETFNQFEKLINFSKDNNIAIDFISEQFKTLLNMKDKTENLTKATDTLEELASRPPVIHEVTLIEATSTPAIHETILSEATKIPVIHKATLLEATANPLERLTSKPPVISFNEVLQDTSHDLTLSPLESTSHDEGVIRFTSEESPQSFPTPMPISALNGPTEVEITRYTEVHIV